MENISINKNLTNIFLINGTFPLDRLRIKVATSYSQKQTTKTKQKKTEKKNKNQNNFSFPFQASQENTVYFVYNFLKFSLFYFHFIYDSGEVIFVFCFSSDLRFDSDFD